MLGDGEAADVLSLLPDGFTVRRPVGAGLREGFEHLVDQALVHEFPRHPELKREPQPRALTNVYQELRAAVAEPGQRREIHDAPTRALLADLAQPLGLGRQSEVAFVLGDRWPNFLTKAIQQEGGTLTVGRARELFADTELAGTPTAVQNLLLLVATEQLGRRFSDHGGVAPTSIARLDDHFTIVEQPLPPALLWDTAVHRAQAILGLTPNPQRSASAVAALADEISSNLDDLAPRVRAIPERLALRAGTLRLGDAGRRAETADAALSLVETVHRADDNVARITAFASFELPAGLTEQTLGASLAGAGAVGDVLVREGWTTIDQLAVIAAGGDDEADAILAALRAALTEDEFVLSLEPRFTAALRQGAALIKKRLVDSGSRKNVERVSNPPPDPPRATDGAAGGRERVVGVAAARNVLERLTADPSADDLTITIEWESRAP